MEVTFNTEITKDLVLLRTAYLTGSQLTDAKSPGFTCYMTSLNTIQEQLKSSSVFSSQQSQVLNEVITVAAGEYGKATPSNAADFFVASNAMIEALLLIVALAEQKGMLPANSYTITEAMAGINYILANLKSNPTQDDKDAAEFAYSTAVNMLLFLLNADPSSAIPQECQQSKGIKGRRKGKRKS